MNKEFRDFKQELYDNQYIDYDGKQVHVTELEDRSVTPEMRKAMRVNSYANDELPSKLTTQSLIETAEQYLSNTVQKNFPCRSYDEALVHRILPELIKRLKEHT